MDGTNDDDYDVYRDSPLRLTGYTNEVGEAFRGIVSTRLVVASYVAAGAYAVADAVDKGRRAARAEDDLNAAPPAFVDALVWQGLASVAIPAVCINGVVRASRFGLSRIAPAMATTRRQFAGTLVGLAAIPVIVAPIDHAVDNLMDATLRRILPLEPSLLGSGSAVSAEELTGEEDDDDSPGSRRGGSA